jgi:23S rRNA pseudouridine2605 synthase
VRVDGRRIQAESRRYWLLNKPQNVLTTTADPWAAEAGRRTVMELLPAAARRTRLVPVGRLDLDSEGLLLLTNDGELGHRLMHPSFEVSKTYLAKVHGNVARDIGKRLREGVELDDGLATVDSFKLVDNLPGHSLVEVVLHEGRKHIVRRLLEAVGYPVEQLVRTAIGEVTLGNQRPGKVRPLTVTEIGQLYRAVGL